MTGAMRRKQPISRKARGTILKSPSFLGFVSSSVAASRNKSVVRKRDTRPELLLRSALWRLRLRYRVDVARLHGRPDIVFVVARVVVFCDGDFWHGRDWPTRRRKLRQGSNAPYWIEKIRTNMARDRARTAVLEREGWRVLRVWEGDILADPHRQALRIARVVRSRVEPIGHVLTTLSSAIRKRQLA